MDERTVRQITMSVAETRTLAAPDGEEIVVETIKTMAATVGGDWADLDTVLTDVLDPDAIGRLFADASGQRSHSIAMTVSVDGFHVSLQQADADTVTIEVTSAEGPSTALTNTGSGDATAAQDVEQ